MMRDLSVGLTLGRLRGLAWAALVAYLVLIAYGSLYPFSDWREPEAALFSFLTFQWPKYQSSSDIAVNIVVYVPLGLIIAGLLRRTMSLSAAMFAATLLGASLSFSMEALQMFLPGRVSSLVDLGANVAGTLFGGLLVWAFHPRSVVGRRLARWRSEWLLPGAHIHVSMLILFLAMLAELSPLLPSLRGPASGLSIMPLWQAVIDSTEIPWQQVIAYAANVLGFGLFATLLVARGRPPLQPFMLLLAAVLAAKLVATMLIAPVPLVYWRISTKAVLGLGLGLVLLWDLASASRPFRALVAGMAILGSFILSELMPGSDATQATVFNWIPFLGQMYGFTGVLDIFASPMPFLILGAAASLVTSARHRTRVMLAGGVVVLLLSFGLEYAQRYIPGRTPDITDVLLFVSGWTAIWIWNPPPLPQGGVAPEIKRNVSRKRWLLPSLIVAIVVLFSIPAATTLIELPLNEKFLPRLPRPEELPPVSLPGFHDAHPRLPAPSAADIARINRENPDFFMQRENFARRGDIHAAIVLARIRPGSQDLDKLHQRLMDLKFVDRGHDQAKPLAVAYDWLYDQWTPSQRIALQNTLAEGCEYLTALILKDRLSPYNVYLYNAPFQGLMAMALALHKDHPQGELALRFVHDLWKNRTLPVWRQVMGRNGGWHEGGEYIALGIGQAVYELPAMWRSATGEDLFKTEPGIRGFLDFIVYRARPDGTHYRIGDGNFRERTAPDLLPLALEFRDAAAYSLRPPPDAVVPTSWPWGPLTDRTLFDPLAVKRKPLSTLFDGIGLWVGRRSWDANATYITLKGGDNFWSHSHLDQGSFTIFQGGPLAIDSGLYGTDYGTDHHMNYTYQAIAHNTITVTDPEDTVPSRTKKGIRKIANDGGQRRIGSGWGVEPAPLDREEWEKKREIYHTGQITNLEERDGVSVIAADLTPAYTNRFSGKGSFSHRTRRVERFWRTLAYDRVDNVIVIFDQVTSSKPEFRKRWLLHTIERPILREGGFDVALGPAPGLGRQGGQLAAYILLPENPGVNVIGGRGFEYDVDGKNFDEDGKVQQTAKARHDPDVGAWRIEVSPAGEHVGDLFLTVLLPHALGEPIAHQARLLRDGKRIGCEIKGPWRTTRWWFREGSHEATFEARDLLPAVGTAPSGSNAP